MMADISSTLSGTHNSQRLNDYQVVTDIGSLQKLKNQAKEDPQAALRPVAQQFEALFVQQILKESRKVQFDDGFLDGDQSDFYQSWHDDQLSQFISAKGNLGLADKIVEQLAPKSLPMSQSELEAYKEKLKQRQIAGGEPVNDDTRDVSTNDILKLRGLNRR